MAKWRFGINKTMSILVAKSHKNLLAKTHTFSSQSRKKRGKKNLSRVGIELGLFTILVASKIWRGFFVANATGKNLQKSTCKNACIS